MSSYRSQIEVGTAHASTAHTPPSDTHYLAPEVELDPSNHVVGLHDIKTGVLYEFASIGAFGSPSPYLAIGRAPYCDIRPADITVSAIHCNITKQPDGSWLLEDHHSTNGTYINGVPIQAMVLTPGLWLRVGNTELCAVGTDRKVLLHASTWTTFLAAGHRAYGSAAKAAAMVHKSASTIHRALLRWLERKPAS